MVWGGFRSVAESFGVQGLLGIPLELCSFCCVLCVASFLFCLLFLGANEPGKERDKPPTGAVWVDVILPQKEFARTVTWSVVSAELHAQSTPSSS